MIKERATVFEENSLHFCKRRDLGLRRPVPPGYRATWDQRHQLAAAKLEAWLVPGTHNDSFAQLLLRPSTRPYEEDFIEVHIFGSLHQLSVERIVAPEPKRKHDKIILKDVERILKKIGVTLETYK